MKGFLFGVAAVVAALLPPRLSGQGADWARSAGLSDWQASKVTPGVSFMPLVGEATKPGAYVYRVRAADGVRIPPHWHTKAMHLTVLSGTLVIVMGESLDSTHAGRYSAHGFLVMPSGMRHAEWFEGETVIHVETEGLFETVFVDPADDPRTRARP